jgi:hypothetical protein
MDYFFTILAVFNVYLYSTIFKLHDEFKNNFPIFYSIAVYIYSEYLAIVKGNLSSNIAYIISFYVLFDLSYSNIILFMLLLLNTWFKQFLTENLWIKINCPILYRIILDISSLMTTILIFFFLDCIFINIIKPFIFKLWNGLLKMYDPVRDCLNNSGSESDKNNKKSPNPNNEDQVNTGESSKSKKRKKKPSKPMSELSPEEQDKRRADNRKYRETRKAKIISERERFQEGKLTPEEEKVYLEKLEKAQAEARQNQKNFQERKPDYHKEQYIKHKDSKIKSSSQYYEANKEAQKKTRKNFRLNNRDSVLKRQREHRLENREEINEKKRMDYNVKTGMWDKEKFWKDHPNKNVKFIPKEKTPEILDEQPLDKGKKTDTEYSSDKGKGKEKNVSENSPLFSVATDDSSDSQDDNDVQIAIRESLKDKDSYTYPYNGESSKKGGSSRSG